MHALGALESSLSDLQQRQELAERLALRVFILNSIAPSSRHQQHSLDSKIGR
jgi:hypothetical protein